MSSDLRLFFISRLDWTELDYRLQPEHLLCLCVFGWFRRISYVFNLFIFSSYKQLPPSSCVIFISSRFLLFLYNCNSDFYTFTEFSLFPQLIFLRFSLPLLSVFLLGFVLIAFSVLTNAVREATRIAHLNVWNEIRNGSVDYFTVLWRRRWV